VKLLTRAEYDMLIDAATPCGYPQAGLMFPAEEELAEQLVEQGRVRFVDCPAHPGGDHETATLTAGGAEAMRLYRLLLEEGVVPA
jgi:hypothetical protein